MLLVDTNVLLSAADTSDHDHLRCAELLDARTDLAVTAPVAAETAWMLDARLGATAEIAFIATIASGELPVVDLTTADCKRCHILLETYEDLRLGVVDASVIAIAERFAAPCKVGMTWLTASDASLQEAAGALLSVCAAD
jgi:predicted nucleic acid-binding protein